MRTAWEDEEPSWGSAFPDPVQDGVRGGRRESEGLKVKGRKVQEMLSAVDTAPLPDFKTLRL
jgi:hypothetical protein